MANEGLKPVGVQLIAENGDQFVATIQEANQQVDTLIVRGGGLTEVWNKADGTVISSSKSVQVLNESTKQFVETENLANTASGTLFATLMQQAKAAEDSAKAVAENTAAIQAENQATRTSAEDERLINDAFIVTAKSRQALTKEEYDAATVEMQAVRANQDIYDSLKNTTQAHGSNMSVMREGRLIMGAMIADMALMQLTAGSTDKSIQELGKSLDVTLNTGLLAFMATGNPAIGVVAGLGAAMLSAYQIATQLDPAIVDLEKSTENLGKQDKTVDTLANLLGVTRDTAAMMLLAAKNSSEYATQLLALEKAAHGAAEEQKNVLQLAGDSSGNLIKMGNAMFQAGLAGLGAWKDGKTAAEQQQAATDAAANSLGLLSAKQREQLDLQTQAMESQAQAVNTLKDYQKQVDSTASSLNDFIMSSSSDVFKLQADDAEKLAKAQRDTTDSIARDWRSLQDNLQQLDFQRVQQSENNAQQIYQINRTLADALLADSQKLNDALFDIAQKLRDKEADDAHQYANQVQDVNDQIITDRLDMLQKIREAEQQLQRDLTNLDWSTAQQLQSAKTQNEQEQILYRASHEKATLYQRANDTITKAQETFDEQMRLEDQRLKKLAADDAYRKSIDERNAQEEIDRANRTYNEEIAAARKRNDQQLADLQVRIKQEEEAYNQQVATAKKRYDEQVADLRSRLAQEVRDTQEAEAKKVLAIWNEIQARLQILALLQQQIALQNALASGGSPILANPNTQISITPENTGIIGAASGMDTTFSSPTLIQVAEGYRPERVSVTPTSSTSSNRSLTIMPGAIQISGVSDPEQAANLAVEKIKQEIALR